jgi:hypothetical protein
MKRIPEHVQPKYPGSWALTKFGHGPDSYPLHQSAKLLVPQELNRFSQFPSLLWLIGRNSSAIFFHQDATI